MFDNVTFGDVLGQMRRWYNLSFTLTDSSFADETLSVHLKNRPIEENLELLAALMNLSYKQDGGEILFQASP